jgi:hypothetical protein
VNKRKLFIFLLVLICAFGFLVGRSFSQQTNFSARIQFASTQGVLKFFDTQTGKVYKYSETDGSLIEVWVMDKLGQNLQAESLAKSVFEY